MYFLLLMADARKLEKKLARSRVSSRSHAQKCETRLSPADRALRTAQPLGQTEAPGAVDAAPPGLTDPRRPRTGEAFLGS